MQKLDRLGWAAGLAITAYGVRIGIRVNEPDVLQQIRGNLPPTWKLASSPQVDIIYSLLVGGAGPRQGVRRFNVLYANAARLARYLDLDEVLAAFESSMHLSIAELAPRRVFVHAGVVAWRGQALLIPGHSHSGKSTLVAALVQAGATYYSDEYAAIDRQGRVHPYPKPLSLRHGPGERAMRYSVESLGGRAGSRPLPISLVLLSHYKAGAMWQPRRLSAGRGILALLAHTVSARRQPAVAFSTLRQVAAHAVIIKGVRAEAHEVAPRLLASLEQPGSHEPVAQ